MKTKTGMSLLSGLLLASPSFVDVVQANEPLIREVANGTLFLSLQQFVAEGSQGFTRKVIVGLRVTKNGNTNGEDYFKCKTSMVPDSITIEILDPATKQVLGVAARMYGKLGSGTNSLFKYSSTYGCVVDGMNLSVEGSSATIQNGTASVTLSMGTTATVKIPGSLTFSKFSSR